ncbi:hypothetical protein ACDZ28_32640 [Paenibacillus sp. RS8]|uniref:hyaluronate lyase N-terminal domain-containing protein n=1 Tax=Paenibacillus sp. RS8 TaxID=3242681 RepID=UPI0035C20FE8
MANKIQLRRGTKAQLATLGALSVAEPGYCTDTKELFIGNESGGNTPLVTATSADITYYVRTDGSDSNTGLSNTAGGAFKTINKAISMIPRIVNHIILVNVAAGTYVEKINLSGYSGKGSIGVVGIAPTTTFVQSIEIVGCSIIMTVDSFTCTTITAAAVTIVSSIGAVINQVTATASASTMPGISLNLAKARLASCVISNKMRVIDAVNASECYAENFTGTGNGANYYAQLGAQINWAGSQASSTAGNVIASGAIVSGGVLNPWGDNTAESRPMAEMGRTVDQSASAGTWNKLLLNSALYNTKNVASTVNNRMVAPETGVYLLNVRVAISNTGVGRAAIGAFVNGNLNAILIEQTSDASQLGLSLGSSSLLRLSAGEYVEIYLIPTQNVSVSSGDPYTHISLIRVA